VVIIHTSTLYFGERCT